MGKENAITGLSDSVGVGSLHMLGLFFILDGQFNFLSFVEHYAQTISWSIFVTVPLLVVSHVVGMLSMLVSEALLSLVFRQHYSLTPLLAQVLITKSDQLVSRYLETERLQRFLAGVSLSFITLGFGSWSEVKMMDSYGSVGYVGLALSVIACCGCAALAVCMRNNLAKVIEEFSEEGKII